MHFVTIRPAVRCACLGIAPESIEVVELHPLHQVQGMLELLLSLPGEAHDNVPCDSSIGRQLPKPEQTKDQEGDRTNYLNINTRVLTPEPPLTLQAHTTYSRTPKTRKKHG